MIEFLFRPLKTFEHSGSIEGGGFLDQVIDYQLIEDSATVFS
jgi:hypothetical protein